MELGRVKSIALSGSGDLITELGGSPDRVARAAGLDPRALAMADLSVDCETAATYFELAARHCGADDFGLRLARRQGLQILGPLWVLARSAGSISEGLEDIVANIASFSTAMSLHLRDDSAGRALCYDLRMTGDAPVRQLMELGLACFCFELGQCLGPSWQPAAVQFRHAAPADVSAHRRAFRADVMFNQDRDALVIDHLSCARPMRNPSERAHRVLGSALRMQALGETTADEVRTELAVRALLPSGRFDLPCVANELGIGARTLQARLARRGASFQGIVDQVRIELATRYLRNSQLTASEISERLHFADSTAFSRFMKTKAGVTPSEIRRTR
jgi:AraC-like DNA-binding protein